MLSKLVRLRVFRRRTEVVLTATEHIKKLEGEIAEARELLIKIMREEDWPTGRKSNLKALLLELQYQMRERRHLTDEFIEGM